ncbi:MAG: hypothetical protein M3N43_13230 [Actinomycetota bacterium]|nr:hypothetical protein [Actinomycetota bacterium]
MRTPVACFMLALLLSGCPSDGAGPGGSEPSALAMLVQPSATANSGLPLAQQPVVQLQDAAGRAVARSGVLVTASLASGGGALTGTAAVRTNAEGQAAWTDLGISGAVGQRTLRFDAPGLAGISGSPVQLGAGAGTLLAIFAGNNQVAAAGTAPAILPRVRVTDAADNPVAGASVTFAVGQGGGSVVDPVRLTAADGTATPGNWLLGGTAGLNTLTVHLTSAPGTVLTFTATGTVGPAAQLQVLEGNGQTATIGTAVAVAPAVRVLDALGNPVAGVAVTFTPAAGSGTVAGPAPVSNAAGIARVQGWTLGFSPGANSLTATRTGVTPAAFSATGVSMTVSAFAAGAVSSCAVLANGLTRCWGSNDDLQLGDGTATSQSVPVAVSGGHQFTTVAIGTTHACAVDVAGAAWCWGRNGSGQLGDGTTIDRFNPVAVQGAAVFTQVTVGALHSCGIRSDGIALCWGSGANGRLGTGSNTSRLVPTPVASGTWTKLSSSTGSHTCGIRPDQTLWCWGFNTNGRLGDGTTTDRAAPALVLGDFTWRDVAVGGGHTCGVTTLDTTQCWGFGGQGQLGTGGTTNHSIPVPVSGGQVFDRITAGNTHTCALTVDGVAWCWGGGGFGQLGTGTALGSPSPAAVAGAFVWQRLSGGGEHTCGRTVDGSALCWGRNQFGQIGDGTNLTRLSPAAVKPSSP